VLPFATISYDWTCRTEDAQVWRNQNRVRTLLFGDSLSSVHGELHKRQRKALQPAFSPEHLRTDTFPLLCEVADHAHARWNALFTDANSDKVEVDVTSLIARAMLDSICAAGFGHKVDEARHDSDPLYQSYRVISGGDVTFYARGLR
jgi:cytochrome P450